MLLVLKGRCSVGRWTRAKFDVFSTKDAPLSEVAATIGVGYAALGRLMSNRVRKCISQKTNLSYDKALAHLLKHGLGPGRSEGVLVHALTMEPKARLSDEGEAKAWLDTVASSYAQEHGRSPHDLLGVLSKVPCRYHAGRHVEWWWWWRRRRRRHGVSRAGGGIGRLS